MFMFDPKTVMEICVTAMAGLAAGSTRCRPPATLNHLTFKKPVALPGIVLAAGGYTFELAPAGAHADLVRVRSQKSYRVVYTGFTLPVPRPVAMPRGQMITFGEAAAVEPTPVAAWFPIDSTTGHEFLYR